MLIIAETPSSLLFVREPAAMAERDGDKATARRQYEVALPLVHDAAERERDRLFRARPLCVGLSGDLPRPGSYFTHDDADLPLLPAALQSRVQLADIEGYQRAQALLILSDMAARINVNRANAGDYVTSDALGTGDSEPASCAALSGAAADLCEWSNTLKGANETRATAYAGAMIGARGCVTQVQAPDPTAGVCAPGAYVVSVGWQGTAKSLTFSAWKALSKSSAAINKKLRNFIRGFDSSTRARFFATWKNWLLERRDERQHAHEREAGHERAADGPDATDHGEEQDGQTVHEPEVLRADRAQLHAVERTCDPGDAGGQQIGRASCRERV